MNSNWHEHELKILADLKLTDKEVAAILGRAVTSVTKKRQRLGMSKKGRGRKPKGGY